MLRRFPPVNGEEAPVPEFGALLVDLRVARLLHGLPSDIPCDLTQFLFPPIVSHAFAHSHAWGK